MHPKTHAKLMEVLNISVLVLSIFLFIAIGISILSRTGTIFLSVFIIWISIVLLTIFSWNISIRCPNPTCNGPMTRTNKQVSTFKVELNYQCKICNYIYKPRIFQTPQGIQIRDDM